MAIRTIERNRIVQECGHGLNRLDADLYGIKTRLVDAAEGLEARERERERDRKREREREKEGQA